MLEYYYTILIILYYTMYYNTAQTGTKVVIFGTMVPTLKGHDFLTIYLFRTKPVPIERPWLDLLIGTNFVENRSIQYT